MEISNQIKNYRKALNLSQEELAERAYVTRQTISNWETGKSYPDIRSLILLGEIFHVSLDNLIKGDVKEMEKIISQEDVKKMKSYSRLYTGFLVAAIISIVPILKFIGLYGMVIFFMLWAVAMYYAIKIEKMKKQNDIQTYKEISMFMQGKKLDEMGYLVEKGKRPYQKILLVILCMIIAIIVPVLMALIL